MSFDIDVPPEMRQLYIERRKNDLQACITAIESQDYAFLEKIGHQVKGNAQSYGFEALSPIATALEAAAKKQDLSEIKQVFKDFSLAIHSLKILPQ